jgi:hypothetical protein
MPYDDGGAQANSDVPADEHLRPSDPILSATTHRAATVLTIDYVMELS